MAIVVKPDWWIALFKNEQFFVHLTNFLFRNSGKNEPPFWKFRMEVVILIYTVSVEPIRAREKWYLTIILRDRTEY